MLSHALLESPWKGDFKKSKKVDSSQPLPDSPKNWSQAKNCCEGSIVFTCCGGSQFKNSPD